MRRAAVAALLAVAACTPIGSGAPSSGGRLPSPATSFVIPSPYLRPAPFTEEDLAAIALRRTDAPEGTEFAEPFSVDQTIDEFASGDEELAKLARDRFVLGHLSVFVPQGQLEHDAPPAEPGATFVQGIIGVFETGEGADSTLRRYVANLRVLQLRREVPIPAEGLGAVSEGLRGLAEGEAVTVFAWRTANLVLVVSGSGGISPEAVRSLADLVQRRADRAR